MSESQIAQAIQTGGTAGLILYLLVSVWALATGRVQPRENVLEEREEKKAALDGWKAQTDATNRLAAAIENANKEAEWRTRSGEPSHRQGS